jgi:hypothetical protein
MLVREIECNSMHGERIKVLHKCFFCFVSSTASLSPISTPLLQLHGKTLSVRFLSSGVSQTRDNCCLLRSLVSQLFIIFSDKNDHSSFFMTFVLREFTTDLSTSVIVIDTALLTVMTFSVDIIPLKVKVSWCFLTANLQMCTVLMWEQDMYLSVYCPESYTNCKSYIYLNE